MLCPLPAKAPVHLFSEQVLFSGAGGGNTFFFSLRAASEQVLGSGRRKNWDFGVFWDVQSGG